MPPSRDEPNAADLLRQQFGNRQSILDSSLPTAVFLVAYLASGSQLRLAVIAAVTAGAVVAALRIVRRESTQHVLGGFLGVVVAAVLAARTGQAEDFFLPGLLMNIAYAAGFLVSIAVRRPLVGLAVGFMTGDSRGWRDDADLRSAVYRATWIWAALFGLRVAVQLPLYLAGSVAPLGTAKLALGFPAFALAAFLTYRLLQPALAARRRRAELAEGVDQAPSAE